jgi:hypothetical protein
MWQELIVGGIVLGAVIYLFKRFIKPGEKQGCAGCDPVKPREKRNIKA